MHKVYLALSRTCFKYVLEAGNILIGNGIELTIEGLKIHLDPKKAMDVSYVSHAHSDHTPRSFSGTLIASSKTCALMRRELRGECWHNKTTLGGVRFSLHDSGHIPGSTQLLIENGSKILYSGDLNLKGGLITPPAETPECDILIIEATFGKPHYRFPDKEDLVKEMRDWVEDVISKDVTPVLLGYSLGKAQELTKAFSAHYNVYVEETAYQFNKRTEGLGFDLGEYHPLESFNDGEDGVLIVPPHRGKKFKGEEFCAVFASGWALNGGWGRGFRGFAGFPLSDHSDFYGLLNFVEKVSPQVVYTLHGYADEFSRHLMERGFYSEPLSKVQTKLDQFNN